MMSESEPQLWAALATVTVALTTGAKVVYSRLTKQLDGCEEKHAEQVIQTADLSLRLGRLEGELGVNLNTAPTDHNTDP